MQDESSYEGSVTEWVQFPDVVDPSLYWKINKTFLLSTYRCTYGVGCPGTDNSGDRSLGCCSQGTRIVDDDDFANLKRGVAMMTAADAANIDHIHQQGWFRSQTGKPVQTRKKNGRCIFSNPAPEGPNDAPMGCAFHHLAIRTGELPEQVKPTICWMVPFTLTHYEDVREGVDIAEVSNVSSNSWRGNEYWCTDTDGSAFSGKDTVMVTSQDALIKMMGWPNYQRLSEILGDSPTRTSRMKGEVRSSSNAVVVDILTLKRQLRDRRVT